ncbi:hypothetical protein ANCDUO_06505 [Ancylostoma duodenale]|uniref:Uncharacterized protein n=1 Tax=Ancylostoma duodenale TaxID=51022 RepID=A0A0C2H1B1_9BILA|nr:hypothetical protein ANCDUO_06505 [Ancylostoma duodenale]
MAPSVQWASREYPRRSYGDPDSYKTELLFNIAVAWRANKTRIEKATMVYKNQFDKSCPIRNKVSIGDLVLIRKKLGIRNLMTHGKAHIAL